MGTIKWWQSNTIRALIVALVAQVLVLAGITDDMASERAAAVADGVLLFIETAALVWAGYARLRQPTPPITRAAVEKTKEMSHETTPTHI